MKIEKSCVLPYPAQNVWSALVDAEIVGRCVPGVEQVKSLPENHYLVTVTVKVGVIKPTFRLNVTLLESESPCLIRSSCAGEANGMLGSLRQKTEIRLKPVDGAGTQMTVIAEIDVFGRLGTFGYGVLKGKADQLWDEFVVNLSAAVSEHMQNA